MSVAAKLGEKISEAEVVQGSVEALAFLDRLWGGTFAEATSQCGGAEGVALPR